MRTVWITDEELDAIQVESSHTIEIDSFVPQALGYIACMAAGFVGVVPLIANSSWVFQGYFGLTPFQYGLCFSLMMLGGSVGAFLNSHLVARAGISKLLGVGTASMAAGGVGAEEAAESRAFLQWLAERDQARLLAARDT